MRVRYSEKWDGLRHVVVNLYMTGGQVSVVQVRSCEESEQCHLVVERIGTAGAPISAVPVQCIGESEDGQRVAEGYHMMLTSTFVAEVSYTEKESFVKNCIPLS